MVLFPLLSQDQAELQFMFLKGVFDSRSIKDKLEQPPDAEVHEKYIELMCNYEAEHVHIYLRGTDNYRLEETLAVSSQ